MAANHTVKLEKGATVSSLFEGEMKKHFKISGNDKTGELIASDDASTKIAYKVQGDSVTFTVTKSPRMFNDKDQKSMLTGLFS
ncbi:MAG TPA: hypothetical protein VK843_03120 [Planctomycetota bacterium]|nr:hypothetical protein [Planctomycetota bacterium]